MFSCFSGRMLKVQIQYSEVLTMATGYVLFNPHAGNRDNTAENERLATIFSEPLQFLDITKISNYKAFFDGIAADDFLIVSGGDGTLNRFANEIADISFQGEILYYPLGTGNDFALEMQKTRGCDPFPVTSLLRDLPSVEINGNSYHFINGIGYGIDGYCCEVGDKMRAEKKQKINYTAIAIKGLLFFYKPTAATVTVDGVTRTYKKVWIAPTMYGKYYGGGMIPCPSQDRNSEKKTLTAMILHGSGKLKTLMVFPSIFKGEHVKHKEMVDVLEGDEIRVEFDRPAPLQIDGETILNVTAYTAKSANLAKKKQNV